MIYMVAHLKIIRHIEIIMIKILKKLLQQIICLSLGFFFPSSFVFFFSTNSLIPPFLFLLFFYQSFSPDISNSKFNSFCWVLQYMNHVYVLTGSSCWGNMPHNIRCWWTKNRAIASLPFCTFPTGICLTDHGWKQDTILWLQ